MSLPSDWRKYFTLPRVFLALGAADAALQYSGATPELASLLTFALAGMGAVLGFRLIRWMLRQAIWRLRNRLVVTYVFIAVVPIVLILALAATAAWMVVGPVATYLVTSELERRAESLVTPAKLLLAAKPEARAALMEGLRPLLESQSHDFEVVVTESEATASGVTHFPAESKLEAPPAGLGSYAGYLFKDGRFYCAAIERSGGGAAAVLVPIDRAMMAKLAGSLGVVNLFTGAENMIPEARPIAGAVPAAYDVFDFKTSWVSRLLFPRWDAPQDKVTALLLVETRPSAVLNAVFGNKAEEAQTALVVFAIIASLLLAVELGSLVIGVSLTRTMTGAVDGLYQGTLSIAKGDFAYRIPVKGKDQLADLGQSFNNMTAQLENLVAVAKEKERLQSEIEIASEVQNQLFPRATPAGETIELIGICRPARMVSGDYFDYLRLADGNIALAIGDVAGKGISAALLMASIQSIIRTQLEAGAGTKNGANGAEAPTAVMVAQLNRQLYASTSPEKYATFFLGVYDQPTRRLTYTNAGHLQPLILRDGGTEQLEVTGTVVGAFPAMRYEARTAALGPGDLLVAFTDGITEPENAYGEEFGAERLEEVVRRHRSSGLDEITAKILESVGQWSNTPELPDDMTLVLARGRG